MKADIHDTDDGAQVQNVHRLNDDIAQGVGAGGASSSTGPLDERSDQTRMETRSPEEQATFDADVRVPAKSLRSRTSMNDLDVGACGVEDRGSHR